MIPPPFGAQRSRWHSFLSLIDVGSLPNPPLFEPNVLTGTPSRVYPLRGTARRLAHRPLSSSNTICNGPDPPLADIVLFGLSLSGSPSRLKTRLLGEGFHTFIKGDSTPPSRPSVLAGTRSFLQLMWDHHQIHPPLGPASLLAHRLVSNPLRGTTRRLAHRPLSGSDTICNSPNPPLADIVLFRAFPQGFKTRLLGKISTPVIYSPFQLMCDITICVYKKYIINILSTKFKLINM